MSRGSSALAGAGKGAAIGTALGAAIPIPGLGTAIGAGLGAGIGALTGGPSKEERESKKLLGADVEAMKQGNLGLTMAEKRQAVQQAMGMAGQQAGQAQAQISRDALAGGGGGQYVRAQQAVGQGVAEAGAGASKAVDEISKQQAEARRQEILGRLGEQVTRNQAQGQIDQAQARGGARDVTAQAAALGDALAALGLFDPGTVAPDAGTDANGEYGRDWASHGYAKESWE